MNHDEKFQQRWEFRRREVDGDTSSDDSIAESADKKHDVVKDLILLESDETVDDQEQPRHDKLDTHNHHNSRIVKAPVKKVEQRKKKNVAMKKSEAITVIRENKRKRINPDTKEMAMFKDLKSFGDSLIHDLTLARENMRDEMGKLVAACRSNSEQKKKEKKNVGSSRKNKVQAPCGIKKAVLKRQKRNGGSTDGKRESNVTSDACKNDQVPELVSTNELQKNDKSEPSIMAHMKSSNGSDRVVSSPYLTLPTVLPKPQFQNSSNRISLNVQIPTGVPINNSGLEMGIGKSMDDKRNHPLFAEKRFGSFNVVSLGSQTATPRVGFAIPFNQRAESGSNISSLTHCENSLRNSYRVGSGIRFPEAILASTGRSLSNSMSSDIPHKADREFVPVRLQQVQTWPITSERKEQ